MAKSSNASGIVSLRLSPEERQLVEEGASRKGWKVAHFLRVSALEKASHIVNLSRPTAFDFAGIARRTAESLRAPRKVAVFDDVVEYLGTFGDGPIEPNRAYPPPQREPTISEIQLRDFTPRALTPVEIEQLHEALRLGGEEFAAELLAECRRVVNSPADPSLPLPVDPRNLNSTDKDAE